MPDVLNTSGQSTLTGAIRFGPAALRRAITVALSATRTDPVRLDDEANQIELLRMAHDRREKIRRCGEELRLLGVRG